MSQNKNRIAVKSELKFIKSLKLKKNRVKENMFIVEGLKNVLELLNSDFKVLEVYSTDEYTHYFKKISYKVISPAQLTQISTLSNNQSCLALARCKDLSSYEDSLDHWTIVLYGISDPGNLGTIIRALDWFGFNYVICSNSCADFYNPKAISASMGSFARINAFYMDIVPFLKTFEGDIYGLDLEGQPLDKFKNANRAAFVLGSESHGISDAIKVLLKDNLTIKKYGQAESLNVAMATNILLYHLRSF